MSIKVLLSLSQARDAFDDAFFRTIFDENATYVDLLALATMLAVIIFALFTIFRPILRRMLNGPLKKIMWKVVELEFNRPDKIKIQEYCQVTTKEEYFEKIVVEDTTYNVLVGSQHAIGGLLAVPAVFVLGGFSASGRSSLACLGILVEMGWEIQDLFVIFYNRVFRGEEGAKAYPNELVIILLVHHSLTCIMGVPVILSYRDLPEVHRLIFDLQGAGAFVIAVTSITKFLDVTKKNDLRMFVFMNSLLALVVAWTRLFDWFFISYKLLTRFFADEKWVFLVVGGFVLLAFSCFNLVLMVIPTYQRFVKFLKKMIEFDSDEDEKLNRSSRYDLQIEAADLGISVRFDTAILELFEDNLIERCHTFNSATLARSAAMASASMGAAPSGKVPRQSMFAWRAMPSRIKQRAENKMD